MPLHAHRPPTATSRSGNLAIALPLQPPATLQQPGAPGTHGAGARARRATRSREAHDGWTFVMIPPGAGARPRTLRISVRRLRFVTAALVTLTGTALVSGSLLAVVLSMAPTIQPESAGVRLGVFAEDSLPVAGFLSDPAASTLAIGGLPLGLAAAAGAAVDAASGRSPSAEPSAGPTVKSARTAERRRAIAPPSMSGRRSPASDAAAVAEARAHGLPVVGRITSRFSNARTHPMLGVVRKHNGVDIAAPSGTPITAAAAGRVSFAGRKFGFGNTVEIDHGNGVMTRYAHARTIKVRRGARVESGATIATVGRTGLASGPHLHFEVLLNGRSVDPLKTPVASLLVSDASDAAAQPAEPQSEVPLVTPPAQGADSTPRAAASAAEGPSSGDGAADPQHDAAASGTDGVVAGGKG